MTTNNTAVCEKPTTTVSETARPLYEPAADVIERPDAIHLLLDLPGVDQHDLDITVEDHILRISGKAAHDDTRQDTALIREFEAADYARSFRLTGDLDEARMSASLKNGLLRVVIPKFEKAKPRQISVQTT